ncbi:MAG: hypothetical protein M1284_03580 [Candidatus Parvarchaeota archaeon]|nr:hypothetical protein [Candidatus Parvarchaeota archaeon]MCL5420799.1 hypothetical protein [Candidatus Parvarchaeota archaeon]
MYNSYKKLGYGVENRSFMIAAEIIKSAGIKSVRLLTNNPKKIAELKACGIEVRPVGIHIKPKNKVMADHLRDKAVKLGHTIDNKHLKYSKTKKH